ncbi:DNA-binding protein [uncultured Rhodoblastus sp.]|uniref:type II toxin-antitoxin system VapC family toxin n=1 Tax=uncultured Rhodoblastus sp. TaxID=543037 RepID=UPI0025E2BAE7|nr:DNA-binding protein [uncultured Rhodoblastus sp.]
MADFDFDEVARWSRAAQGKTLSRRQDADLSFVNESEIGGNDLLLDTCVYIDQMQGRTPEIVETLIEVRQANHSTVAIQELMHTVGVLDPSDPRTASVVAEIRTHVMAMRPHRTFAPEPDVLGKAAMLSGIICHQQHYGADNKLRVLMDCVLFIQALKLGFTVLTANIGDFDLLLQLVPGGRVLFYRRN